MKTRGESNKIQPAEKPSKLFSRVARIFFNRPGGQFQMSDGANYRVAPDGSIRSTDPPRLTKKQRNKLKREARRKAA